MGFDFIEEIKEANRRKGGHWFEPSTMRFFKSRIVDMVYFGQFFISSEKGPNGIRAYTIRRALPDGEITTFGQFQEYKTLPQARAAIRRLAARVAKGEFSHEGSNSSVVAGSTSSANLV